jgi:nucleoside-diphosphate-sugar epimerase
VVAVSTVAVTGARGQLGVRVCERIAADPGLHQLRRIDVVPPDGALSELVEGVDTLIVLGDTTGPETDGTGAAGLDLELVGGLLDAARAAGVCRLVVVSSAMVYGAWPDNPVPLTEDAPMRPVPQLAFAVQRAELERMAEAWASGSPERTAVRLRPCVAVSEHTSDWLGRSLWQTGAMGSDDLGPPAQYVHLDDLAAAVDLARRAPLEGPCNVAPDGWIAPEDLRALASPAARLRLPSDLAVRLARLRWRMGLTPTPPEVLPYTVHPWVVANDRLRAAGWEPSHTNEEALVVGVRAGPWATMTPRRRQELALGAVGAMTAVAGAGAVAVVARSRRRGPRRTGTSWPLGTGRPRRRPSAISRMGRRPG